MTGFDKSGLFVCFVHNALPNSYYNVDPQFLSFLDEIDNFESYL